MALIYRTLQFFGQPSDTEPLDWSWIHDQLAAAGTYWTIGRGDRHPQPRPVWGVWLDDQLHLSIGSPSVGAVTPPGADVTVHLGSGTDVVIVEARVTGPTSLAPIIDAYNAKYDWAYTIDEYGPLTTVAPERVLGWRSAGWAGRDGFVASGCWTH